MNIPFKFQKSNKGTGCEDAPPKTDCMYSVVCDGLGGAGSTKHTILQDETNIPVVRTSGFLGSRIVSECVAAYYEENAAELFIAINEQNRADNVNGFVGRLKDKISADLKESMQKWGIEPSHSKTLKDFPTTLASAVYHLNANGLTVLAVWAGDSRIYALTPQKGLQLLSLDDAQNAENKMNSTSEMTNCISAGNDFHLNYAVYELNEPGIVFCCSDGCFDYLQSPLHFEWLLLHTIIECMPDSEGEQLGAVLADSVCDTIYKSIGDDTTMAGIIFGMDSGKQMKNLYRNRMDVSDKLAVSMNEQLKTLKKVQNEKDTAQKSCRLSEEKVFLSVHDAVCKVLQSGTIGSSLRSKLTSMPCYAEYARKERDVVQKINKECEVELQRLKSKMQKMKTICRNMLICDYVKLRRQMEDQRGSSTSFWGAILSPRNREQMYGGQMYSDLVLIKQSLLACIEMYKHPYCKAVFSLPGTRDEERDNYIQSQISMLGAVLFSLDTPDRSFENLWSQAYYSTEYFEKERHQCGRDSQFNIAFERALSNPRSCEFASELSMRKLKEYSEQTNGLAAVDEKYKKEKQRRLASISEEFWSSHKNEILDTVLSENEITLRNLFKNTDVPIERIISYIDAKRTLGKIDNEIVEIQCSIDRIWDAYKEDYQLFKQTEKGVC